MAIPDVQQVIAPSLFPTFMEDVPNKESDAVVPEKVVNKEVRGADAATAAVQMVPKNEEATSASVVLVIVKVLGIRLSSAMVISTSVPFAVRMVSALRL